MSYATEQYYLNRIASLEAELAEQKAIVEAIKQLHREEYENGPMGCCRECYGSDWPCETILLIEQKEIA